MCFIKFRVKRKQEKYSSQSVYSRKCRHLSNVHIHPVKNILPVTFSQGKASEGPLVPHPEEPGGDGGVLRASLEGSFPLGRPAEPTAHG